MDGVIPISLPSQPNLMPDQPAILTQRFIVRFWSPLAVMWITMAIEQPLLAGVIARMPEPKLQLAAFGITFTMALLIESPIIMLLSASTALVKGRQSYGQLLRFTTLLSVALTAFHLLVTLTPLFNWFVGDVVGAPPELIPSARLALLLMTPWSAAVAYRRMWQGVMIRFGLTDQVGVTNILRLAATAVVVLGGMMRGVLPGAALAGLSLSCGVVMGAAAAWWYARPLLANQLCQLEPPDQQISMQYLVHFYTPLALSNIINFAAGPVLTLGLSRSLLPLESLALWPVVSSLSFLWRSLGFAYQDVVVALLHDSDSLTALRRFAFILAAILSSTILVIGLSPLNHVWYGRISGLTPDLVALANLPTILISLTPALSVLVALNRGILVHTRHTRPVSVAVAINVTVLLLVMLLGPTWLPWPGVVLASLAFTLASLAEVAYLRTQTKVVYLAASQLDAAPA
jgi:hypothetical protein